MDLFGACNQLQLSWVRVGSGVVDGFKVAPVYGACEQCEEDEEAHEREDLQQICLQVLRLFAVLVRCVVEAQAPFDRDGCREAHAQAVEADEEDGVGEVVRLNDSQQTQ